MSHQTSAVELPLTEPPLSSSPKDQSSIQNNTEKGHALSGTQGQEPENEVEVLEKWNEPRRNTRRLAVIFFAFINLGMNESSYGPLLPYVCP